MAGPNSIFDPETLRVIKSILRDCKCQALSIGVRSPRRPDVEMKTFRLPAFDRTMSSEDLSRLEYAVTDEGDTVFACASLTKYWVAVALKIAVEYKAKEEVENNRYSRFSQLNQTKLRTLYNEHRPQGSPEMCSLPGEEPNAYLLLTHAQGLPPSTHRILGPEGSPLTTVAEFLHDLPSICGTDTRGRLKKWTKYSNINYSLLGILIEALWRGSLGDFMQETLFGPFGMNSTTIGFDANNGPYADRYVVDSCGNLHRARNSEYQSNGPEAPALGGYTTVHDMDRFLNTLLSAFSDNRALPYIHSKFVGTSLLGHENEHTEDIVYTPLGLYTTLDSPIIGSMSSNRLLNPDARFSTYETVPRSKRSKKRTEVYYMAGSAVGCSSASAFLPGEEKKNIAVTALANTSGPVDPSDHVLRLMLRKLFRVKERKLGAIISLVSEVSVEKHVKDACATLFPEWQRIVDEEEQMIAHAPNIQFDIAGTFVGRGFSQRFAISRVDGKLQIVYAGSTAPTQPLRVIWLNEKMIKICVPPHLCPDRLGDGDWSELTFGVHTEGNIVNTLTRRTDIGTDVFDRTLDV
jgi:hypothetical protein